MGPYVRQQGMHRLLLQPTCQCGCSQPRCCCQCQEEGQLQHHRSNEQVESVPAKKQDSEKGWGSNHLQAGKHVTKGEQAGSRDAGRQTQGHMPRQLLFVACLRNAFVCSSNSRPVLAAAAAAPSPPAATSSSSPPAPCSPGSASGSHASSGCSALLAAAWPLPNCTPSTSRGKLTACASGGGRDTAHASAATVSSTWQPKVRQPRATRSPLPPGCGSAGRRCCRAMSKAALPPISSKAALLVRTAFKRT
jgi:hypothetical protein